MTDNKAIGERPDFSHEVRVGRMPLAGVDEAGCGAWAGPVVSAAVIFQEPAALSPELRAAIRDSKTLSPVRREQIYHKLQAVPEQILWSVGLSSVKEIEALNIRKATLLAMKRAVEGLAILPQAVLVDGLSKPELHGGCEVHTLIKGDSKSLSIAAASIIAKVTRDRLMGTLHEEHPHFGWDQNRGYGTQSHQEALKRWGVSPHHRRTYAPIAALL